MVSSAERKHQCRARYAEEMHVRCDIMVTEAAVHTEDHTGRDQNGHRIHWTEAAAMYPAIDGGFRPSGERAGWLKDQAEWRAALSTVNQAEDVVREKLAEAGVALPAARDTQVGGEHYKKLALQPWDIWEALDLGAFEGSIIKYVLRYKDKNGVEDLKKARHTLDRLIEIVEARDGGS